MTHNKLHTIKLSKTKGDKTIALAKDVFISYIDSDFQAWGTNRKSNKTAEMNLEVYEMSENATFKQLFTDPDKMCLTQEQIIQFCTEHKDKLAQNWYTFFLFKVDAEFFVANVDVYQGGLSVRVNQFSHGNVWYAEDGRRFVLPQLTTSPSASDPLAPRHSNPSDLQKVYTKYRDEAMGITAKVSDDSITIKNSKGTYEFVFKNSSKTQVKKVCESILNFLN